MRVASNAVRRGAGGWPTPWNIIGSSLTRLTFPFIRLAQILVKLAWKKRNIKKNKEKKNGNKEKGLATRPHCVSFDPIFFRLQKSEPEAAEDLPNTAELLRSGPLNTFQILVIWQFLGGGGFSFVESFHFAFSRFDHDDCSKIALLRAFTAKQGFTPLLMLAWLALVSVDSLETQISCEHLKLLKHQDFLQFD